MKKLISSLIVVAVASPITVSAQQLNTYQVCHTYQEQYTPGYYTNNGSYIQGGVYTLKNTVNCQTGEVYSSQPYRGGGNVTYQQPYYRRRNCNPAAGALLGAGIASAIAGGNKRTYSGNYQRYYGRNYSAGNWSNTYKNNYSWSALGAGLGSLIFSC